MQRLPIHLPPKNNRLKRRRRWRRKSGKEKGVSPPRVERSTKKGLTSGAARGELWPSIGGPLAGGPRALSSRRTRVGKRALARGPWGGGRRGIPARRLSSRAVSRARRRLFAGTLSLSLILSRRAHSLVLTHSHVSSRTSLWFPRPI